MRPDLKLEAALSASRRKPGAPGRQPRKGNGPARVVAYLREDQRAELLRLADGEGLSMSEIIVTALVACGAVSR